MKIGNLEVCGIIYKITNKVNNKVYIGQTINENGFDGRYCHKGKGIERVYNYHKGIRDNNSKKKSYNEHLLYSIEKYGFENFKVDKIFDIAFSIKELNIKEELWIKYYNSTDKRNGYNIKFGGDNYLSTEEEKHKNSISQLGYDINMYKNYIIDNYNKGLTATEIAKKIKISSYTILKYLRKWGIKIRTNSEIQLGFDINLNKDEIIDLYLNKNYSLESISNLYNVDYGVIKRLLKNNNVLLKSTEEIKLGIKLSDYKDEIIDLYLNKKLNPVQIGKIYGVDENTIRRRLIKWKIKLRNISEVKLGFNIKDIENDIINLYENNKTIEYISNKFKIHYGVIRKVLENNNIHIKNNSEILLGFNIDNYKDTIIKLYIEENKSTREISEIFNVSQSTIINNLNKWNVHLKSISESKKGKCIGKNNYMSVPINIYNENNELLYKAESISEASKWLVKNNITKKENTAKDAIITCEKENRLYKKKYKFKRIKV